MRTPVGNAAVQFPKSFRNDHAADALSNMLVQLVGRPIAHDRTRGILRRNLVVEFCHEPLKCQGNEFRFVERSDSVRFLHRCHIDVTTVLFQNVGQLEAKASLVGTIPVVLRKKIRALDLPRVRIPSTGKEIGFCAGDLPEDRMPRTFINGESGKYDNLARIVRVDLSRIIQVQDSHRSPLAQRAVLIFLPYLLVRTIPCWRRVISEHS